MIGIAAFRLVAFAVALVLFVAVVIWGRRRATRRRLARDAALALAWEQEWQRCRAQNAEDLRTGHLGLVLIHHVYQYARHGSKAVVVWSDGHSQDTWFANWHVSAGTFAVIGGNVGWGDHNQNPRVLYVNPGCLITTLPATHRKQQSVSEPEMVTMDSQHLSDAAECFSGSPRDHPPEKDP